jgi:hypothetical protein
VYWSDLYALHLDKWLFKETFTTKKTVLTYEGLKRDIAVEFSKVTRHFGMTLDLDILRSAFSRSTKEEVGRKTQHDSQVVQLNGEYAHKRQEFRKRKEHLVWRALNSVGPHLKDCFWQ